MKFFKKKDKEVAFSNEYVDPLKSISKEHRILILRAESVPKDPKMPSPGDLEEEFKKFLVSLIKKKGEKKDI